MVYAQARTLDEGLIPVVDIAPLRDGTYPMGVAKALHAASKNLGFIYVKGHGIPEDVIETARNGAYAFFNQKDDLKASVKVSPKHRGWLGQGGAKMKDGAKADLKESFIWGYENSDGDTFEDHDLRGANLWPSEQPDMRS